MKNRLVIAASMTLAAVVTAGAQTTCPAGLPNSTTASQNTQNQAADLFQYMAPQLGTSVAGGNAALGQNSTLGGLGHFSIGVHATGMNGTLPTVSSFPQCYTGAVKNSLQSKSQLIGAPVGDLEIGIFKGIPLGLTNVGGIDAIISASYIPEIDLSDVKVTLPDGSLKIGFGGRLGLVQESLVMPGISATYLIRDLPEANIRATSNSDTLIVNGLDIKTRAWRVVAGKSFLIFGLSVGAGKDEYRSTVKEVRASVNAPTPVGRTNAALSPAPTQKLQRTNVFGNLSLNLPLFKLVGEIGHVSGGDVTTFNSFQGTAANADRTYYSAGLRFGF